ncbi:hypothetical protein ACS0TY_021952 [Phlomoides rotata]
MAGIGKTTLAGEIFEDPWTLHCYDRRVWITLGPNYESKRILKDIADCRDRIHQVPLLNEEESWSLLRERAFGEKKLWPRELEKPGKLIADKCDGLPLMIVVVADLLSKADESRILERGSKEGELCFRACIS